MLPETFKNLKTGLQFARPNQRYVALLWKSSSDKYFVKSLNGEPLTEFKARVDKCFGDYHCDILKDEPILN